MDGQKVAVLVAEGFEDLEYWVTVMRLREEGAEVIAVGPDTEPVSGKNALGAQADTTAEAVDATGCGRRSDPRWLGPGQAAALTRDPRPLRTVYERNKTVGIICHGGLVAISAA